MVTEAFELIDRFEKSVDANGYRTRDKHTEEEYLAAKSDLEAALSAAEPQPAPSLAVKALQAAIEELDRISCVPFVTETRDTYAQLELAKAYADRGSMAAQKALSALSAQVQDARSDDDEEIYEIGVREGYERAVQEIDIKTGGDGEYRYCTDRDPDRHTPGPAEMIQRIVDRFETLNLIGEAEKRGDFWGVPGSAQVQDVAGWQIQVTHEDICNTRDGGPCNCDWSAADEYQAHPDDIAVDRFAEVMKAKLAKKRDEGRGGWEDKDECSQIFLSQLLREHVEKGDPVDVGNLAMMLHQRGERIASLLEALQGE